MSCKQTEEVSALMDGELAREVANKLRKHIGTCEECAEAEMDFILMRRQIRGLAVDEQIAAAPRHSWIGWRISIPAPVFGIALLVVAGLVAVLLANRAQPPVGNAASPLPEKTIADSASLARFDGGGKAQIYKETRR
ncbi:MAG: zf-HC2 domain-containing protein [Pyrinomonadaceae bacterium]|nr:zf-HC2 domain-containing protein [Pyrinomonadaceae bacterium]